MWVKIDDGMATHPKLLKAGPLALAIQIRAICYASQNKTDGFLPFAVVPLLTFGIDPPTQSIDWPSVLIDNRLWDTHNDGYVIHDFLDWNLSKRDQEKFKEKKARAGRKGASSKWSSLPAKADDSRGNITAAEWREMLNVYDNHCLRCGSTSPLVRDHVIPRYQGGTNHVTNIQPLCRSCNSSKGSDTTDYRLTCAHTKHKWLADASQVPAHCSVAHEWHATSTSTSSSSSNSSLNFSINQDSEFEKFWKLYPKKKGKKAALKAWKKAADLPSIDRLRSVIEQEKQTEQWKKDRGQYIPHPATWLNEGRWADEPTEVNGMSDPSGMMAQYKAFMERGPG